MFAYCDQIEFMEQQPDRVTGGVCQNIGSAPVGYIHSSWHNFVADISGDRISVVSIEPIHDRIAPFTGHEMLEAAEVIAEAVRLFVSEPFVTEDQILGTADWKARKSFDDMDAVESASLGLTILYSNTALEPRSAWGVNVRRGKIGTPWQFRASEQDRALWNRLVGRLIFKAAA